jgi:transcriptional regulator with GAF, ATPase, and Fis domain
MARSLRLTVEAGGGEEAEFLLSGQDAVLGRDPAADVMLDHPTVSARHGILRAGASGYAYTDLASRNGSALRRDGGPPRALPAGEATPIQPGDELLLGAADTPVRVRVREGRAPFAPASAAGRTVVASSPLADLLGGGPDVLASLAARSMSPEGPEALAAAALDWLLATLPRAGFRSVHVAGAGFAVTAGDPMPPALAATARDRGEAVLLRDDAGEPRVALVAPLLAAGGWHGTLAAWSPDSAAAVPASAVPAASIAASLVGLAAASLAVRKAGDAERDSLAAEVRRTEGHAGFATDAREPLGVSPGFLEAVALCRSVASASVPVVLVGETGTGKEVLARWIHRWSLRADRKFVAFNCAAVPETLLESELFGHVRGAFTGAGADRKGLFEEAAGGTIFLDEIGEMPLALQAKLLRVLQDGEVRRVGSDRVARVDVRVVSATNRDLWQLVERGAFRSDLLYRLNAVTVRIPPLRDRPEDVPLLAHRFLGAACRRAGKRVPAFSAEALAALAAHDYPGNVRELENEVLRAVALTPEGRPIEPAAFSEALRAAAPANGDAPAAPTRGTLKDLVEAAEKRAIEEALDRAGGNVSRAARALGLTRPGLYKVMARLRMRGSTED